MNKFNIPVIKNNGGYYKNTIDWYDVNYYWHGEYYHTIEKCRMDNNNNYIGIIIYIKFK